MRRFVLWSFMVGIAYYSVLFGVFGRLVNRSGPPLNEALHIFILYVLPVSVLIAIGVKVRLLTGERGFIFRALGVLLLSMLVCFISLQLAGATFCIVGRECF